MERFPSLPFGIGDLGPESREFLRWSSTAGQTVWQMLPLVVPDAYGSPYQSPSAFAGNPALLPPDDAPPHESEFEEYCARITSIIFPAVPGQAIELNLNLFNLDTYF